PRRRTSSQFSGSSDISFCMHTPYVCMDRRSNHSLFVWSLAMKTWVPRLPRKGGPTYLALANEIAAAIEKGELRAGSRLPPQRELAEILKIDVTTVSRAMTVA